MSADGATRPVALRAPTQAEIDRHRRDCPLAGRAVVVGRVSPRARPHRSGATASRDLRSRCGRHRQQWRLARTPHPSAPSIRCPMVGIAGIDLCETLTVLTFDRAAGARRPRRLERPPPAAGARHRGATTRASVQRSPVAASSAPSRRRLPCGLRPAPSATLEALLGTGSAIPGPGRPAPAASRPPARSHRLHSRRLPLTVPRGRRIASGRARWARLGPPGAGDVRASLGLP